MRQGPRLRPVYKIALSLVVLLLINGYLSVQAEGSEAVVAVVLYHPTCEGCRLILETTLPELVSQYNGQLQVIAIDVTLAIHQPFLAKLAEYYGGPWDIGQLPIILIGERALVGQAEIESQLANVIREYAINGQARSLLFQEPTVEGMPIAVGLLLLGGMLILGALSVALLAMVLSLRRKVNKPLPISPPAQEDKTLRYLIGLSGSGVDILSQCLQFLDSRRQAGDEGAISDARGIIRNILNAVARANNIEPIVRCGSIVSYDPAIHTAYESVEPNAQVQVVEVGWRRGDKVLKNAIVKRVAR